MPAPKAADSDDDEDAPVVVGDDGVEELAIDDFRTQFPMAFGEQPVGLSFTESTVRKSAGGHSHHLHAADATGEQEKATARLEEVHASTLRHAAAARKQRDSSAAVNGADALGDAAGPPRALNGDASEGDGADVGPPR
jgi:hypothetical protein